MVINFLHNHIISIHAPAKGATVITISSLERVGISIHAPAKGATGAGRLNIAFNTISIHAPAKGATRPFFWSPRTARFQSTLPRRERPSDSLQALFLPGHFNPRSREGSDVEGWAELPAATHFNPRSREGSDGNISQNIELLL